MERVIFIGIDPGLSGAVASIDGNGGLISVQDVPTILVQRAKGKRHAYLEGAMLTLLRDISGDPLAHHVQVILENVHAMPGQGVTSMFTMGEGIGLWRMAIAALSLPLTRAEPTVWKREMGVAGSDKGKSVIRALQLFPTAAQHLTRVKDHGRAEALLLAEWGRRRDGR